MRQQENGITWDEKRGMLTGWYQDPQDGRWYYLDLTTGEMLTGWRQIPGWGAICT